MNRLPFQPPLAPMLSKAAEALPSGDGWQFEPKWDGFRAIVFRGEGDLFIQSRDLRPLDRYFPELHDGLLQQLPPGCVIDGEIVIMTPHGLDFDLLQLRLHPAASRVAKLAAESPASFVAWDLLALGDEDLRAEPLSARRERLEQALGVASSKEQVASNAEQVASGKKSGVYLSPATRDRALAEDWFERFEGAGLDGVMAKAADAPYQPGKRAMIKVKHARTADCVVAGFRWHKNGKGTMVGSLLLGLYDEDGTLHHVGVTAAFAEAMRRKLVAELAPLREGALQGHPWREWAEPGAAEMTRMPGGQSRWSAGKDLSWEPLRIERVCEVKYDHLQRDRFRHGTTFLRWRPDKRPEDCRYDQLEVSPPYELERVFGSAPPHGS